MQLSIFKPPADLDLWTTSVVTIGIDVSADAYGGSRFPALVGSHLAVVLQGQIEIWDVHQQGWSPLPGAFLTGPQTRPLTSRHRGPLHCISLFVRPSAVSVLVGDSATHVTDGVIDASAIWGTRWQCVEERIRGASSDTERADLLFDFLRRAARNANSEQRLRRTARLHDSVLNSMAGAAGRNGMSTRQLQRRFVDELGLSPKRFQRIARVEQTLRDALSGYYGGADLAMRHGFYDQAHMARDLRELVGVPVTELLQDMEQEGSSFWPLRLARTPIAH